MSNFFFQYEIDQRGEADEYISIFICYDIVVGDVHRISLC